MWNVVQLMGYRIAWHKKFHFKQSTSVRKIRKNKDKNSAALSKKPISYLVKCDNIFETIHLKSMLLIASTTSKRVPYICLLGRRIIIQGCKVSIVEVYLNVMRPRQIVGAQNRYRIT